MRSPDLVAARGVGTDTAGALLVAAGDNPRRLRSEAAFAHLCGVAPIDASSGLTSRHRLNRGRDHSANQALWRIVMVRMAGEPRTRAYVARRTAEGRSKREIIRVLKRYSRARPLPSPPAQPTTRLTHDRSIRAVQRAPVQPWRTSGCPGFCPPFSVGERVRRPTKTDEERVSIRHRRRVRWQTLSVGFVLRKPRSTN